MSVLSVLSISAQQLLEGSNAGIWSSQYLLKSSDYRRSWHKNQRTGKYKFYLISEWEGVTWERAVITQKEQCLLFGRVWISTSEVLSLLELKIIQRFLHFRGFLWLNYRPTTHILRYISGVEIAPAFSSRTHMRVSDCREYSL